MTKRPRGGATRRRGQPRIRRHASLVLAFFDRRWPLVLITVGLALLLYSGLNGYYYDRSIQPAVAVESSTPAAAETPPSRPARLTIIESVSGNEQDGTVLDETLEPQRYEGGKWTVSDDVGSYLDGSAKPGEGGNIIIYGHNKQDIFGPLTDLDGTESVRLTTEDGREYDYRITSLQEVTPEQTQLLQPTDEEVLTIYTCSGWLDSKRFVVRARPLKL